ncbi:hypothetical protein [Prochlorococcus sp. MIT 0916]|uniref:hypothetical protein n=1 Tax=Prochlorococcus sp. MIT 0916 TaxID=3082521 RepID=UPI0039B4E12C
MKSQLTLVAAVFFGAMGGSFLTRIIEPALATNFQRLQTNFEAHCHGYLDRTVKVKKNQVYDQTSPPMFRNCRR